VQKTIRHLFGTSAVIAGLATLMAMSIPAVASAATAFAGGSRAAAAVKIHAPAPDDTYYSYYNYTTSGPEKCMTNGGSTKNSAPITQYECNGDGDQLIYYSGSTLELLSNSKCLSNGGSTENSAPITQYTCNGSQNQEWELVGVGGGFYKIQNYNGTFCMTNGGSNGESKPITQYHCNGSNAQKWSQI
jgi:hypothetical protein